MHDGSLCFAVNFFTEIRTYCSKVSSVNCCSYNSLIKSSPRYDTNHCVEMMLVLKAINFNRVISLFNVGCPFLFPDSGIA